MHLRMPVLAVATLLLLSFASAASIHSRPTIDSISPSGGPQAGGTLVTLHGSGFKPNMVATVGGVPATMEWIDPSTVTLITPPGDGVQDIQVLHGSGTDTAPFRYFGPPPEIRAVSPQCLPASGMQVTMVGRFAVGSTVTLNGELLDGQWNAAHDTFTSTSPVLSVDRAELAVVDADGQRDGHMLQVGSVPANETLSIAAGEAHFYPCLTGDALYQFYVDVDAHRLRVAADVPYWQFVVVEVYGPGCSKGDDGCLQRRDSGTSPEVFIDAPKGVYQVIVDVSEFSAPAWETAAVRIAAEDEPDTGLRELLPNLRPEPPFEVNIAGPVNASGLVPFFAPGGHPNCRADEHIETAPVRCLRFTFGWQNAGDGPLEVVFRQDASDPMLGILGGNATQRVYSSDGSFEEHAAGTYEFHEMHTHYHHHDFVQVDLLAVHDTPDGKQLAHVGEHQKLGVCGHDIKMVDFHRVYQAVQGSADSSADCLGTGYDTMQGRIGLSAGWTDFYDYTLNGNYVDFADLPDGEYVLRSAFDPLDHLRESDEDDNVGYAWICVRDDVVTLLGRGSGADPWDPDASVLPHAPGQQLRPFEPAC